jgi:DUF1365 family protein
VTAALYPCRITHVRARPVRRAFRYRSYLWLVDLDDLPRVPAALRPFAGFQARDHLGGPGTPGGSLRSSVDAFLVGHGISLVGGRVLMLAHARVLGYVFNPITVYWCYGGDGRLAAVIAEVHNTYGGRHAYLLHPDGWGRAEAAKNFYVSPFLPVAGRYRLRLPEPAATLRLGVTLQIDGTTMFAASVTGTRRRYTPWRLLGCALRYPWSTLQVTALIHGQGLRLAARRLPIQPGPRHHPLEGIQ